MVLSPRLLSRTCPVVEAKTLARRKSRAGQTLIEYVLMTALLSTLTFAFVKFMGSGVFAAGLNALPAKAGPCLSQGQSGAGNLCQ